jgi:hypothetical protein
MYATEYLNETCFRYDLTGNADNHEKQNIHRTRTMKFEALFIIRILHPCVQIHAVKRVEVLLFYVRTCGTRFISERVGLAIKLGELGHPFLICLSLIHLSRSR